MTVPYNLRTLAVAGIILPLFIMKFGLTASTMDLSYNRITKIYENSDKVYAGTVKDIKEFIISGNDAIPSYLQLVEIDVYVNWKGTMSATEEVWYVWDSLFDLQPLLEYGTDILIFAKNFYSQELDTYQSVAQLNDGSIQEYEYGSIAVKVLQDISQAEIIQTSESNLLLDCLALSSDWIYSESFGMCYLLSESLLVSERLGLIYIAGNGTSTGWHYHQELGWIFSLEIFKSWIWCHAKNSWIYISPVNKAHMYIFYYELNSNTWNTLGIYPYWYRVGFH